MSFISHVFSMHFLYSRSTLNTSFYLERFLPKNRHTQRKLLNFENWVNWEVSKIGHHFKSKVISKLMLSKNVNSKKCAPIVK